jgi:hypothetical protein
LVNKQELLELIRDLSQGLVDTASTECPGFDEEKKMEDTWLRARKVLRNANMEVEWPRFWGDDPEKKLGDFFGRSRSTICIIQPTR